MAWLTTPPLTDAIGAYIAANVAAKVAALNAEYADAHTLTAFASDAYFYTEKDLLAVPKLPAVAILEVGVSLKFSSVTQLTQDAIVDLHVLETQAGGGWNASRIRLKRWRRALLEMVKDAEPAGLAGWIISGPPSFPQPGSLTKDTDLADSASVRFSFHIWEPRS